MKKIEQYIILSVDKNSPLFGNDNSYSKLSDLVNEKIKEGWQPYGDLVTENWGAGGGVSINQWLNTKHKNNHSFFLANSVGNQIEVLTLSYCSFL